MVHNLKAQFRIFTQMPARPAHFSRNPLKRPFPDREFGPSVMWGHARTAIFVFAVLYVMRPFGLDFGKNALPITLGYGLVTFIIAITYHYGTEKWLGWERAGGNWTLGRWVLDCAIVLTLISIGNFIYHNFLVGWGAFSLVVLAAIAVPTVLIGLFPIAFSGMFIQMQAERDNQRTAGLLARVAGRSGNEPVAAGDVHSPTLVALTDELALAPGDILFCEARGNYVRVVYLSAGVVRDETIRATLSHVASVLDGGETVRCHRSFVVNTDHVTSARGNAQGLRLNMVGIEEEVPVSRAYVQSVKELVLA